MHFDCKFGKRLRSALFLTCAVISMFSTSACVDGPEFDPTTSNPSAQVLQLNRKTGAMYIKSKQSVSVVAIQQLKDPAFEGVAAVFDIKLANLSAEAVPFSLASISVSQGAQAFAVMGLQEMQTAIKNRETTDKIFAALAIVGGAVAGGVVAGQGSPNAAYAMTASSNLMQQGAIDFAQAGRDGAISIDETAKVFLTPVTIPPSAEFGALFSVQSLSPRAQTKIQVSVGLDTHVFYFNPR